MTLEEWRTLAVEIKRMYERYENFWRKKDTVDAWYKYLDDLRFDIVEKAVHRFIKNSPYPPTIADIRKNYEDIRAELNDQLRLVRQELEMFEWKFYMGYNGQRREIEKEFARLTVDKCGGDYELARRLGVNVRRQGEAYIEGGGNGLLLDWLRSLE